MSNLESKPFLPPEQGKQNHRRKSDSAPDQRPGNDITQKVDAPGYAEKGDKDSENCKQDRQPDVPDQERSRYSQG